MHKKQQGFFSLVSLTIVLAVVSTLIIYGSRYQQGERIKKQAEAFTERLEYLKTSIDSYQSDKIKSGESLFSRNIFPNTIDDLSPTYIPTCSTSDNNLGNCRKPLQTPWGVDMVYRTERVNSSYYRAVFDITLPTDNEAMRSQHRATAWVLNQMGGMTYSSALNRYTWRIERLGDALAFEQFLKKDGTESLTGDWDVGNKAILNASTITARGSNGKQVRADGGVVKRYSTLIGGNGIYTQDSRFTCATGLSKDVKASFNGIKSPSGYDYLATGEIKTDTKREGAGWRTKLTYKAKEKKRSSSTDKGTWRKKYDGYVDIIYLCVPEL